MPDAVTRYPVSRAARYQRYKVVAEGEVEVTGYTIREVKGSVSLVVDGVPIEGSRITVRRIK